MQPRDPVFGCVYCRQKMGKTTDLAYAFPRAIWIAAPGATAPMESVCGYSPLFPPVDVARVEEAIKIIEAIAGDAKRRALIDALIIDDLTLYVDRTVRALGAEGVGAKDPRELWGRVRLLLLILRDTAARAGIHVFLNAHEQPPKTTNAGAYVRGGPSLPGAAAELVPAACSLVLRGVANPSMIVGWPVEYRCDVRELAYVSGDRHNVTPDHAPMNLGEILRAQGFNENSQIGRIRRHPDMPWQEEIVEKIAGALLTDLGNADFVRRALTITFEESIKQQGGIGMTKDESAMREKRAIWTQRDAYDRAILRNAQTAHRRRLFG